MFTKYPTYSVYRTLRLTDPLQYGEDVFALQTALNGLGFEAGKEDGWLGQQTATAIKAAQKRFAMAIDGLAGSETQKALAMNLAFTIVVELGVPSSAIRGQLEHESSFRLGNYSPLRADRSYDAGVTQRNTSHTPPVDGFTVPASIEALAKNIKQHYDLFAGVADRKRRWALAQGTWNAPAFACYIAKEEGASKVTTGMTFKPSLRQRELLETYIADVSIYLDVF